jgi:lipopolysaccharide/colanic/teichoic acid biosynthesis glycosyltransferase
MRLKRAFDLIGALGGIIVSSPIWAVVAVTIRATSPGPVLYRAQRVGRNGSPFTVFKFRTMRTDMPGAPITASGDPRITPIGRLLRRTKLDELPQLINVVRGEMSLVGPRPEDPRYVALYDERQRRVLAVPPGITSPASIAYRHEESLLVGSNAEERYVQDVMPAKLEIELAYIEGRSLWRDVSVLLRTAGAVLRVVSTSARRP